MSGQVSGQVWGRVRELGLVLALDQELVLKWDLVLDLVSVLE